MKQENITGVDLSDEMMNYARERFPQVNFIKADVLDADTVIGKANQFDAVFFNACFGNIFDQKLALKKTHDLLRSGGSIVISHPLGKRFVKALHDSDPAIVPHFLPEKEQLSIWQLKSSEWNLWSLSTNRIFIWQDCCSSDIMCRPTRLALSRDKQSGL